MPIIYLIRNLADGKVYVGKTEQKLHKRLARHWQEARNGNTGHLYNAIRKYGKASFVVEVVATTDNPELLDELEVFCIKLFKSTDRQYGYNKSKGGDGIDPDVLKSLWHDPEYRRKMANRPKTNKGQFKQGHNGCIGRVLSSETKIRIAGSVSRSLVGNTRLSRKSPEERQAIFAKGWETRRRNQEARQGI